MMNPTNADDPRKPKRRGGIEEDGKKSNASVRMSRTDQRRTKKAKGPEEGK
jgi:hypothetical protein